MNDLVKQQMEFLEKSTKDTFRIPVNYEEDKAVECEIEQEMLYPEDKENNEYGIE